MISSEESYYRARYYDQNSGRFISEDPVRFHAGTSFYYYVHNRPLDLRDPKGLFASGVGILGSAGGGVYWFGGSAEGSFYWVHDSLGNHGVLSCSGFGLGAVTGASASTQVGTAFCPDCNSICDMEGSFGGAQAFGASVSNTGVTVFASGGLGGGVGGGLVGIGGSCNLVWKSRNCPQRCSAGKK